MTSPPLVVLVVDDEPAMRHGLGKLLEREGYRVHLAADGETALRLLHEHAIDVVITDLRMRGVDGLDVLRHIKEVGLDTEVILLTGHGSIQDAVAATKLGAYDFLTKPPDTDHLVLLVGRAAERLTLSRVTRALEVAHEESLGRPFIATSAAMQGVLTLIDQVAPSDTTVLIEGESGTGKELVARAIHARGPRRKEGMIAVNCAAIPAELIESELFGYEKGAFTGAVRRKPGRFELAHRGTLFLDEIGELAPGAQAKLLRVVQEREVEPLGATRPQRVDTRIVAATNRRLRTLVAEGRFREDLYHRLNVVLIEVPPLRERPEDIPLLAEHFLTLRARKLGKRFEGFTPDALVALQQYDWPGNVRELENVAERTAILSPGPVISAADLRLPAHPRADASAPSRTNGDDADAPTAPTGPAPAASVANPTLAALEREWILSTLARCGGNQRAAAHALGIDRSTLHRKLKQYGAIA